MIEKKKIRDMTFDETGEFIVEKWNRYRRKIRIPKMFQYERAKGFEAGVNATLLALAEEEVLTREDEDARAWLAGEAGEYGGPEIAAGFVFRHGLVVLIVEKQ